jgi:preprotein translocase subunit SecD
MVVKDTSLSTKGSLPATKATENASDDHTKTTAGHKTQDPQGPDNDQVALEEGEEEITEESLDEILKELESTVNEVGMEEMGRSNGSCWWRR